MPTKDDNEANALKAGLEQLEFFQMKNAEFDLYEKNPIVRHRGLSMVVADPSVIPPEVSRDGLCHMFCHTFFGIDRYESRDMLHFTFKGTVVKDAMRPNINYTDGKYVLYYERTQRFLRKVVTLLGAGWASEIYAVTSEDLIEWSTPQRILKFSKPFEASGKLGYSLSNPFLIKIDGNYRLYYSCGLTYLKDCGFSEPTHINFASATEALGDFVKNAAPIISPDADKKYINLCSGCIKVYKLKDCYIGLQNGIYSDGGKSKSAIWLLRSQDGISFEPVKPLIEPQVAKDNNRWMAQYVYACDLQYTNGKLYLYFNARNASNYLEGRENIGVAIADIG
jgi:hypothetical protein